MLVDGDKLKEWLEDQIESEEKYYETIPRYCSMTRAASRARIAEWKIVLKNLEKFKVENPLDVLEKKYTDTIKMLREIQEETYSDRDREYLEAQIQGTEIAVSMLIQQRDGFIQC
jgi:nicotinic acid mononucleotide adenylyltransferase